MQEGHVHSHGAEQEHAGPSRSTLLVVGIVLVLITFAEFGIIYLEGMQTAVLAVLFSLSAIKFFLVASIFMHLRFDKRLLAAIFGVGVFNAVWITIAQVYVNRA